MLLSFPRLLFETESRLITPSLPSLPRREAEFRKRFKKRGEGGKEGFCIPCTRSSMEKGLTRGVVRFRGCLADVLQGLLLRRQLQHETSRKRPSGGPLTAAHRGRCFNQQLQHRPRSPLPFQPLSLSPPALRHSCIFPPRILSSSSPYLSPPPLLPLFSPWLFTTNAKDRRKPTCAPEILRYFLPGRKYHENKYIRCISEAAKVERQR